MAFIFIYLKKGPVHAFPAVFLTRGEDLAGLSPAQQREKPHFFTRSKGRLMQKVIVADDYIRALLGRGKSRSVHADWSDFYHCTGHGKGKLSRIIKTEEAEEQHQQI